MAARQMVMLLMAVILSLPGLAHCFQPFFSADQTVITHRDITRRAVLRKTAEVCQNIAASEGRRFSLNIDDNLTVNKVQEACTTTSASTSSQSTDMFQNAINDIVLNNAKVDSSFADRAEYHFNNEAFQGGKNIITAGMSAVKANVKLRNFVTGRQTLGRICHTLQDFYSHSNWVELGKTSPYSALIRPDQSLENLAGPDAATCQSCTGTNCVGNILPDVLTQGLLTSGYFSKDSSAKPAGKCSHGGFSDKTSQQDSEGGINKDTVEFGHDSLHNKAASLAVDATMELLEDIRVAVGDRNFLRLMSLYQATALCIVIDTTGSMCPEIAEVKRVSSNIIDRQKGAHLFYILVPFHDPGYGPVTRTYDGDVLKGSINNLTAAGGADLPEMSLSGLQLALTAAPPSSEIFVFTDAPAKDDHLKSTITALIESKKSKVTFILSDIYNCQERRSEGPCPSAGTTKPEPEICRNPHSLPRLISQSDLQLYYDLAQASGGQVIEVTKSDVPLVTSVIEDSSVSGVVTVFQIVRNPGRPEKFTFTVDALLSNTIIYITGTSSLTFRLTSSTGISQTSSQPSGPLVSFTTVGNLRRLSVSTGNQTGPWEISINSNNPYSVKVTGQSSMNFIYNLVEAHEGARGDFSLKEGRPTTDGNVNLLVTVTGSDIVKVTEVTLFDSSGPTEVSGSLQSVGSGSSLVTFSGVPAGDFVVRLKGEESSSTSRSAPSSFQRQISTQIKTSSISVTAQANNSNIEPGSTISIPFTVSSNTTGTFTVRVNNDRNYISTSPSNVTIAEGSGGTANGTVTLTVPASAATGTDVTLTIEAEDETATDINYAVLRFPVVARVTDLSGPECQVVTISGVCPASSSLCASSQWKLIAHLTDGISGTGIESITIHQGNGTLNTSTAAEALDKNVTIATYSASCCSQKVELAAVDRVGNVGWCVGYAEKSGTATPVTAAAVNTFSLSYCLWLTVGIFLL